MSDNQFEIIITMINSRMDAFETKLDDLVSFKWRLLGGAGVLSALISLLTMMALK